MKQRKPETKKFKITYEEKYKKGAFVKKHLLPKKPLPYMNSNVKIVDIELRAAGVGARGGERVEFQDVRIYVVIDEG